MKLSDVFELRQYLGLGPMSDPPYQNIRVDCQSLHCPGPVICSSEQKSGDCHSVHAPVVSNSSPVTHSLKATLNDIEVSDNELLDKQFAFEGLAESMPVVENVNW